MTTIQIEVSDELIAEYGAKAIQEKFEKDLRWESLRRKALALKDALDKAGLDHDEITKEAKKRAWEIYKSTVLKGILPTE
jgi:predicted nucleic acid-binding protein